jgi:hypothetical protein
MIALFMSNEAVIAKQTTTDATIMTLKTKIKLTGCNYEF